MSEPIFCVTSDIDWAPEWAVARLLTTIDQHNVSLTPFMTHYSPLLWLRYGDDSMRRRAGLHPNFLPGSTHGSSLEEVVEHVFRLWPEARGYRSHAYCEWAAVPQAFYRRGFRYDSNLNLFLQPRIEPLAHVSGLWRFPVFWTDAAHLGKRLRCDLGALSPYMAIAGLKLINIHPMLYAINAPNLRYYEDRKWLYRESDEAAGKKERYSGRGIGDLLDDLLGWMVGRGYPAVYLDDLYAQLLPGAAMATGELAMGDDDEQ